MKTKTTYALTALALAALLVAVGIAGAFPLKNNAQQLTDEQKTMLQDQQEAIRDAITNNDFNSWKIAMQERINFMESQLTEENFNSIVEMHNVREEFHTAMIEAKESGDYSQVQALQQKYGIQFNMPKNREKMMQNE